MSSKRNPIILLFWRIHPKLFRWSGGRIGKKILGLPVLLLTTKGRKSGLMRTKALMYLPNGKNFVVVGSNLGYKNHPAWWLNLLAEPTANVYLGNRDCTVRAREAEGDERETLWGEIVKISPGYDEYKTMTERKIPVVVLEPV